MTIRTGYDNKPTRIKIHARDNGITRQCEVWIEQEGVARYGKSMLGGAEHPSDNAYERIEGHSETLAYATLDELLTLKDEIAEAIQVLVA